MQRRHIARYAIRQFGLSSLLKFGFVLGLAASLIPSLTATFVVMTLVSALRQFLEGIRSIGKPITILGQTITFDFVDLLHLSGFLETLQFIDGHAWLFGSVLFILLVLASAISLGIITIVVTLVYNAIAKMIGGLEIELEELMP